MIKDDEIAGLEMELKSLADFLDNVRDTQLNKIRVYKEQIEENKKVIKR